MNTKYHEFPDLLTAYLETLRGRPSHIKMCYVASQWIGGLSTTPTRAEILARHQAKGHGHFQPGASQANTELALMRAACRWGLYQERWDGGDPTAGIKKWKTPKRKRTAKYEELRTLGQYFDRATSAIEIRDRALYGLMYFTGCRMIEARRALLDAITPYGTMGCWLKGKTKTGENQELPLPAQLMPWIAAWQAIRPPSSNPYLFPGQAYLQPITATAVRLRWKELRLWLRMPGLWNYDLRRTLASCMSNELHIDDVTIRAILNHSDGSALSHYCFKSFDALCAPIQAYADWLMSLRQDPVERQLRSILAPSTTNQPAWRYSQVHPLDAGAATQAASDAELVARWQQEIQQRPPVSPIIQAGTVYERDAWQEYPG